MNIYQFINHAQTMLQNGGLSPRASASGLKARRKFHQKLTNAYGNLWAFRIKHPDSKRSRKAKQRAIEFRGIREMMK